MTRPYIDPLVERDWRRARRLAAVTREHNRLLPDRQEHEREYERRFAELAERDEIAPIPLLLTAADVHTLVSFVFEAEQDFFAPSSTEAQADTRDRLAAIAGAALLGAVARVRAVLGMPLDEVDAAFERLDTGRPMDAEETAPPTRTERMELRALTQQMHDRPPLDRALTGELGMGPLNAETAHVAGTSGLRDRLHTLDRVERVLRHVRVPVELTVEEAGLAATALIDQSQQDERPAGLPARRQAITKLGLSTLQALNRFMGKESPELAAELAQAYAATPPAPEQRDREEAPNG